MNIKLNRSECLALGITGVWLHWSPGRREEIKEIGRQRSFIRKLLPIWSLFVCAFNTFQCTCQCDICFLREFNSEILFWKLTSDPNNRIQSTVILFHMKYFALFLFIQEIKTKIEGWQRWSSVVRMFQDCQNFSRGWRNIRLIYVYHCMILVIKHV